MATIGLVHLNLEGRLLFAVVFGARETLNYACYAASISLFISDWCYKRNLIVGGGLMLVGGCAGYLVSVDSYMNLQAS